jgi:formate/nitrite transporter FocA (FNT family)
MASAVRAKIASAQSTTTIATGRRRHRRAGPPPAKTTVSRLLSYEDMPRGEATPRPAPSAGTRLSEEAIHDNVLREAEEELQRPASELGWSGVDAGMTIGFSFAVGAYVATLVPDAWKDAAVAAAYPLGFIFVVLARAQLFTENTLEPVVPALARRNRATVLKMLRLWSIVLPANLAGALVFGVLAARTPMFGDAMHASLSHVAEAATTGGFVLVLYRAIFAGWLVALMAWLISSTRDTTAQIALVWLTTAPIAALGLRHSIAGSVEAFYRAAAGQAGWLEMATTFIVPAVIGNTIGGVALVALLNHAQVPAGSSRGRAMITGPTARAHRRAVPPGARRRPDGAARRTPERTTRFRSNGRKRRTT